MFFLRKPLSNRGGEREETKKRERGEREREGKKVTKPALMAVFVAP